MSRYSAARHTLRIPAWDCMEGLRWHLQHSVEPCDLRGQAMNCILSTQENAAWFQP